MKKLVIEPTEETQQLTVQYWRERFDEAYKRFGGLTELAKEIGPLDDDFKGLEGFRRVESVKRGKAGLLLTAKAVRLMLQLRPKPEIRPSLLGRQKLKSEP